MQLLDLTNGVTLVDVGAAGEIMPRWKRIETYLNYNGFEPDERSRIFLLNKPYKCISYIIYDKIVSEKESSEILYLCETPTVSSTLKPNIEFLKKFPKIKRFDIVEKINLKASSIDNLKLKNADFIKLDIQGGELNALKGAKNTLKNVLGIEVEIEFHELYQKQPLFSDVTKFLKERDFEFIDFSRLVRWDRNNIYNTVGQCVWGDGLYMRSPEYVIANITEIDVIKRYLVVCLLYNRFDYINIIEKSNIIEIDKKFFKKASTLRRKFQFNQLLKRRINKFLSLLIYFDEEIHTLH